VPHGLVNRDLSLEWFKQNFKGKLITDVKKITFCGDDGDPIYAKDFLNILEWLRGQNNNLQFVIVTNGSYKTRNWWQNLKEILNEKDHIHFSLDGWDQESNNLYRINCDWESIMTGVKVLHDTTAYKTWAAIAFKFNEQKIDYMKQIALALRFDNFQLTLSTKFGKNYDGYPKDDPLQPSDEYVATGRFARQHTSLSNKKWIDTTLHLYTARFHKTDTQNKSIIPLCMIGNKGLYINAQGKFFPCCWTGLRYQHNQNIFDYISAGNDLGTTLDDPHWETLFNNFSAVKECGEKCNKQKWNLEHATSW